jgi:hypothetical protein
VRTNAILLLFLAPPLLAQPATPRLLYIYRDSLKSGFDSAYRAIENDGAKACADFKCPNPYLALESLSGAHEAWWINAFASAADTVRVVKAYAENQPLADALASVAKRKAAMIGTPIQGSAVHRPDLSRGAVWPVAGARFIAVTVTRVRKPADGSVWEMPDSTLYVFKPLRTREEADAAAKNRNGQVFAIRPNWSMPAQDWVAADPEFWRLKR